MLRPLLPADLREAHRLSAAVSWPHRLQDWELLNSVGNGLAWRAETGALTGTAMWWPYGSAAAAVGMVLVAPAGQGRGIGRRLMAAVMESAGERSLRLNATEAGLRLYQSLGFSAVGAVRQHQGLVGALPTAPEAPIRLMRPADRRALLALDTAAFGASRAVLEHVIEVGRTVVLESNGTIAGFAVRRSFGRGDVVGPVIAAREEDAIALVAASAQMPGFLRLDIPADATRLADWLTRGGMPCVDTATAMTHGAPLARATSARAFALVSQALS
jgi:GNAT superfamily N-acetyltransferase